MSSSSETFSLKRNWIFGGWSFEYTHKLAIGPGMLSDLVDALVSDFIPSLVQPDKQNSILDFKGRDQCDSTLNSMPKVEPNELLLIQGVCATGHKEPGSFVWEGFTVRAFSDFDSFIGNHHIRHTLRWERLGTLPSWLPVKYLGLAVPIEIRGLRFYLEHFQSNFISNLLGFAPGVAETFYIDCDSGHMIIQLTGESRSKDQADAIRNIPAFQALAGIIKNVSGFDVIADLIAHQQEHRS